MEARSSSTWGEMLSDPMVRETLESMHPFIEKGAVNPIELVVEKFIRFRDMLSNGVVHLSPMATLRHTENTPAWSVLLAIPGQPDISAEFQRGVCHVCFIKIVS